MRRKKWGDWGSSTRRLWTNKIHKFRYDSEFGNSSYRLICDKHKDYADFVAHTYPHNFLF